MFHLISFKKVYFCFSFFIFVSVLFTWWEIVPLLLVSATGISFLSVSFLRNFGIKKRSVGHEKILNAGRLQQNEDAALLHLAAHKWNFNCDPV